MFYRDPGAEDSGILAGIIDLSLAKSVQESEVARNYGFTITVSPQGPLKPLFLMCFRVIFTDEK